MKTNNLINKFKAFFSGDKKMTDVTKAVNYTDAMVQAMVLQYTSNPTPATVVILSKEFNKTTRSIVAKLVREGVYKAQPRVTKTGAVVIRKSEIVSQIQDLLGVNLPTLEKASKLDLDALLCSLTTMSER
jgi:hypothetical protein|tara:strand:+ start:249 stop:638 length:390 start_codon:yes stop_codon:yes gene_type:complete